MGWSGKKQSLCFCRPVQYRGSVDGVKVLVGVRTLGFYFGMNGTE
jgi:hypothetical protein